MRKPVKTLPPANLPPYLQAFLVTMESGAVALARVMADGMTQGREAARAAALEAMPGGAVWDSAAYPVGPEERAAGPGLDMLKPALAAADLARRSAADLARAIGPAPAADLAPAPAPENCKACRHWGAYRKGECDRVGGLFTENPAASFDIVATALDDSGLSTGLVTGPEFSCRHWAKRKGGK